MIPTTNEWERFLAGKDMLVRNVRLLLRCLPSPPRCKLCNAPFAGPGAPLVRLIGMRPWERNPKICGFCASWLRRKGQGGAEVHLSLLFADIRGSTALAESMSPSEYSGLINQFFIAATKAFVQFDAITDQLVGDEAIGLFLPGYAGPDHAWRAVEAAAKLLELTGHDQKSGPWLPVGIGIHTGLTFVGTVGSADTFTDFTAMGDSVNTTARLASFAGAGEILVSEAAQAEAKLDTASLEHRSIDAKGKAKPLNVLVVKGKPFIQR